MPMDKIGLGRYTSQHREYTTSDVRAEVLN